MHPTVMELLTGPEAWYWNGIAGMLLIAVLVLVQALVQIAREKSRVTTGNHFFSPEHPAKVVRIAPYRRAAHEYRMRKRAVL